MATNVDLQEAFTQFCEDLREYCVAQRGYTRMSTEMYNHKRCLEVAVWFTIANQEFGHCFLARSMEWNGGVDWDRVKLIMNTHDLAIGPHEETKVWNLAKLGTQTEPQERCTQCGLLK